MTTRTTLNGLIIAVICAQSITMVGHTTSGIALLQFDTGNNWRNDPGYPGPNRALIVYRDYLPTKSEIFNYWKGQLSGHGILIDWGEPGCWACGFHYGNKYDVRRPDAAWEIILRCWDRVPLQRCHIVPKSLGGSNTVDNLFLMCRECHDLAPNTPFPEIFFEWARSQSHFQRESAKTLAAMAWFGLKDGDFARIERLIQSAAFKAWVTGRLGIHRPQSNYAAVSCRLTPSTMVGLAVHYMRTVAGSSHPSNSAPLCCHAADEFSTNLNC